MNRQLKRMMQRQGQVDTEGSPLRDSNPDGTGPESMAPRSQGGQLPLGVAAARSTVGTIMTDGQVRNASFRVQDHGIFLTTAHTFEEHRGFLEVLSHDGRVVAGKVLTMDPLMDLAVISADAPGPSLKIGSAQLGGSCWLLGMQSTLRDAVTPGTIVAEPTYRTMGDPRYYVRSLPISSPVQVGSSGAPWVTAEGHAIGIQSGFFNGGGIALAAIVDPKLMQTGVPDFGADLNDWCNQLGGLRDSARQLIPGVRVYPYRIPHESAARDAGLIDEDLILECDGKPVRYADELLDVLLAQPPGSNVQLRVLRRGEQPFKVTASTRTRLTRLNT